MAERRRRRCISNDTRQRFVTAFKDPREDYLDVADTLGVNRATARSIIATFLREGRMEELPRSEEMQQCLNEIIDANSLIQSTCLVDYAFCC